VADARKLAEFTELRRADLVALTWCEISETHIARTASKKSRGKRKRTVMPIVPGLKELLEEPATPGRRRHRAGRHEGRGHVGPLADHRVHPRAQRRE
jgi:integrase